MATTQETKKPGLVARAKARFAEMRRRHPLLDHAARMLQHYGDVQGNVLAGAVTFFGFLSFFPVLALAFAVVGYLIGVYPEARDNVTMALQSVFPGLIGDGDDAAIQISVFEDAKVAAGVIGVVGLLYSGLGWLSGLRNALQAMFLVPKAERRNLVVGKLVDLSALAVIGLTLMVSVALSGAAAAFTTELLELVALDDVSGVGMRAAVWAIGIVLGIAASTVLFLAIFRILPKPDLPGRALLHGALLAAAGFEVLKLLASTLIRLATNDPAFAVLGVALVLLVWINYFSRVTLYGAAWAITARASRVMTAARLGASPEGAMSVEDTAEAARGSVPQMEAEAPWPPLSAEQKAARRESRETFAAGAVLGALVASALSAIRRSRREDQ